MFFKTLIINNLDPLSILTFFKKIDAITTSHRVNNLYNIMLF